MTTRVLLIGAGAREHAIADALVRGRTDTWLSVFAQNDNPALRRLASTYEIGLEKDKAGVVRWASKQRVDLAVIGLEDALEAGVPDALEEAGVPTVGPSARAAQVETSKPFLRELMTRHAILGNVDSHFFTSPSALEGHLRHSHREYALKPVGLTAGKGVQVMGVQLRSIDEAVEYGKRVIREAVGGAHGILLEERLLGVEFTLQVFVDGKTIVPTPLVKDYKLAYDGDWGPNTGSMGSYSQADGGLAFVPDSDRAAALSILRDVVSALEIEGTPYRGVMYGQFMETPEGPRLVEINARLGDPEGINVLALLESSFLDVCEAITVGGLAETKVEFLRRATVCQYLTPPGYPNNPREGSTLELDESGIESRGVRAFLAKVNEVSGRILTTRSRSIALLGIADTVDEAQLAVMDSLQFVRGEYHMRRDIGTRGLIAHDRKMMRDARDRTASSSLAARR